MITTVSAIVVTLPHAEGLELPQYATPESAGADLMAAIDQPLTLNSGERFLVPTGLALELPKGYEAQIRPRSGLAFKHGITVLNAPGTIDSDYRGELKVLLINHGSEPFRVERGMKIAQLVLAPVMHAQWHERDDLTSTTLRGVNGFGSTGY
ncbi:deoxyuridine 5'-triphosphate nucleotidohydrolase [Caedimonas varicaedens]|jgi:dUTP pyrophosphatase|uniref:Deoxyuridine 5'-triphosphate nucleotidohydrolase n=1 Tax=Caedimonas varicaedens TaxID=1629334 RepID=A0A0K8MC92_9PROT|nr:deoxyuridine 5'-triphosphate nucleotidohydrolase [Caedimonas varicaedens]